MRQRIIVVKATNNKIFRMNTHKLRPALYQILGSALLLLALPGAALATDSYPSKPIRFIIPYAAGGGTDIAARIVATKLSDILKQPIIIDSKPGGDTIIGTAALAKSAPDGYTIGFISSALSINSALYEKLPYDAKKDLEPVALFARIPLVLVASPAFGIKSVRELITRAKTKEDTVRFASIGAGSVHRLAMTQIELMTNTKMVHIPYKGVAPALTDVVGGHVDVMFSGTSSVAPYVKSGKLTALGISSPSRNEAYPDIPTINESGLPGYSFVTWYGIAIPKGTPASIVQTLNRAIAAAVTDAGVKEQMQGLGLTPASSSIEEFTVFMAKEDNHWLDIVRRANIKAE